VELSEKKGGSRDEGLNEKKGGNLDFVVPGEETGVDQRIGRDRGSHICKGTRVEQGVSGDTRAKNSEAVQKQRSSQECHAV
jgi:hypothetical protein